MDERTETQFMLRLPPDLHDHLVKLAQAEHRSLQSLLVTLLRSAIDSKNTTSRQDVIDQWDETNQGP